MVKVTFREIDSYCVENVKAGGVTWVRIYVEDEWRLVRLLIERPSGKSQIDIDTKEIPAVVAMLSTALHAFFDHIQRSGV